MDRSPLATHRPELDAVLRRAAELDASDVHWTAGQAPLFRLGGELIPQDIAPGSIAALVPEWIEGLLSDAQRQRLEVHGAVDGALSATTGTRWRYNVYRAQGRLACAMRRLDDRIRDLAQLGLPKRLYDVCHARAGLVLVAGPTGSGKSTTLAALVDRINQTRRCHIMTIEDPIEYIHVPARALVTQRQVGWDAPDFYQALVDALRQDPDVILVGEIRELHTIRTALTAAETGHLVFASVHAADCAGAIERLLSVFPGEEQRAMQHLLSMTLRTVVAQHLVAARDAGRSPIGSDNPAAGRERILVSEILQVTPAVSNLIAQMNLKQIRSVMETGAAAGMFTMDQCLASLLRRRLIDESVARGMAHHPQSVLEMARQPERQLIEVR